MTSPSQSDLQFDPPSGAVPAEQITALRNFLSAHGWSTRRQICEALGWSERQLRDTAEALGSEIVRGQAGFKLTSQITRDDIGLALQAAEAFLSQANKMSTYALALKKKLHAIVS